jgi:hypothetical protein
VSAPPRSFNLSHPKPPIVLRTNHQPRPHRILPDILEFLAEAFIRPKHMIQRLILPNWPGTAEQFIYAPSRNSLEQLQDYRQRIRPALQVAKRSQQQVHMIGHHNHRVEIVSLPVVVLAMLKNKIARACRKRLADQLSKCHKDCPVSLLINEVAAAGTRICAPARRSRT